MYLNLGNLLESRGSLVNNVDPKGRTLEIMLQKAWEGVKEPVFSSGASCHSVMPYGLHHCHHYPGKLFSKEFHLYFHVCKVPTFLYKLFSLYLLLKSFSSYFQAIFVVVVVL